MSKCFLILWSPTPWLLLSYLWCPGVMRPTLWYQSKLKAFMQTNKQTNNTQTDGTAVPEVVYEGTESKICLQVHFCYIFVLWLHILFMLQQSFIHTPEAKIVNKNSSSPCASLWWYKGSSPAAFTRSHSRKSASEGFDEIVLRSLNSLEEWLVEKTSLSLEQSGHCKEPLWLHLSY